MVTRTGTKREDCYGTRKKVVINSKYSKSDNSKRLSVLVEILRFFETMIMYTW